MATNIVENSFTLMGLLDGTTIYGFLRVDGSPLVQRYTPGTTNYIPDFEADGFSLHPVIAPILRDSSTGNVEVPTSLTWKYNGETLVFNADDLSTNEGMADMFQRIYDYPVVISGTTYRLPALKVLKNLVSVDNRDNDRISVSGKVEIGGNLIEFQEMSKDVLIKESDGSTYDVLINDDGGGMFTADGQVITMTARVYKEGAEVTSESGVTYRWVKETADGDVNMGSNKTQQLRQSDVNGLLNVRCDIRISDSEQASGYHQIKDATDEYHIEFNFSNIKGNALRKGESTVVTPKAVTVSGVEKTGLSWSWYLKKNDGANFTGYPLGYQFTASSITVTYQNVMDAGGGIKGYVSASW